MMALTVYAEAQVTDAEKIVGTWKLDSVNMEGFSEEDRAMVEEVKNFMFMTFNSDSTVILPDFESDFDGVGDVPTVIGVYHLKDKKLYLEMDGDVLEYEFVNDDYLELKEDGESMFFKRQ